MTKTHEIKLLKKFADDVLKGKKTFEIRKNDRDYQVGDYVRFRVVEFEKGLEGYPVHPLSDKIYRINYLIDDPGWGLQNGFVVFGIVPELENDEPDTSRESRSFGSMNGEIKEICGFPLHQAIDILTQYRNENKYFINYESRLRILYRALDLACYVLTENTKEKNKEIWKDYFINFAKFLLKESNPNEK